MSEQHERREVIFRGQVQGVGFRYMTRQIAGRFQVAGFVRNQSDGTVQLVVEGEPAELDRFIRSVAGEFDRHITDQTTHVSPATGEFSHFGVRPVLGSGLLMMTAGLLLFTRIGSSGSAIVYVVIPGVLTAAGIAMSIVPSTIAATQGAKEGQAGLASGLVNTSRQVGGGLGLALLITLATQHSTDLIGQGAQVADALTHGFRLAYLIGACLTALTARRP